LRGWPRQVTVGDRRECCSSRSESVDDDGFETTLPSSITNDVWSRTSPWYEDAVLFVVAESSIGVRVLIQASAGR
jgi:hypothetical protein